MTETLGPYELQKRIGTGGMADVFLAKGPRGICVIKRPHPHLTANPEFVRMFLDEAAILAQLHHPNIAELFDLGAANGAYYLAMEYVPGFDLMTISLEHERQGELMAPELCARIVADAAGALHFAHEAKDRAGNPLHIIHRDVSPHNVLLSTAGVVKLIDFGVARTAAATHRTQAGLVKGKYAYMSPEQITNGNIDRRVDIYALGLVLYELLTNSRAIAGTSEVEQIDNARSARIRPVEQLRANITTPLRQIIGGCLHPDPNGRYPTALAVKEDLEKYLGYERHVVGQEDLLRLFRVVAAEAGHTSPADPQSEPLARVTEPEQAAPVLLGAGVTDLQLRTSPASPSQKVAAFQKGPVIRPVQSAGIGAVALTQQIAKPAATAKWFVLAAMAPAVIAVVVFIAFRQKPVVVAEPDIAAVQVDAGVMVETAAALEPFDARVALDEAAAATPVKASVLFVRVDPPSDVSVDGQSWTGLTELELMPGKHEIVMSNAKLGFTKRYSVDLKPGDRRKMDLMAREGTVDVTITPFGTLAVDRKVVAENKSFKSLTLWEGTHTIEASVVDGDSTRRKKVAIDVKPGTNSPVKLDLMP